MDNKECPSCGAPTKRNGRTKVGTQRWRCGACGASATHGNDTEARRLASFVSWPLSNGALVDIGGGSSEVTLVVGGVDAPSPAFAPPYRATAPFFLSRSNQERKQFDSQESSKIPGRKVS